MSHIRFQPTFKVIWDGDNIQYGVDWDDSCQGEYDDDEGDELGMTDYSEVVEVRFHEFLKRLPALHGYPSVWLEGEVHMVEVEPAKAMPGKRPTCAFYNPSQEAVDINNAIPLKGWAFGKHFPYGVCTNPQMVGPGGFGPCRFDGPKMDRCNVYAPDLQTVRGQAMVSNHVTILESSRAGQAQPAWQMRTHVAEETEQVQQWIGSVAREEALVAWNEYTNGAPLVAEEPKTKPFLKDLVGVCRGAED